MEFTDKDSIPNAQALDESLFKGRQIKVGNELYFFLIDPISDHLFVHNVSF